MNANAIIATLKEKEFFLLVLCIYVVFLVVSFTAPYVKFSLSLHVWGENIWANVNEPWEQNYKMNSLLHMEKMLGEISFLSPNLIWYDTCGRGGGMFGVEWLSGWKNSDACVQENFRNLEKNAKNIFFWIHLWAFLLLLGWFFFGNWKEERSWIKRIATIGIITLAFITNAYIAQLIPPNTLTMQFNPTPLLPLIGMNLLGLIMVIRVIYEKIVEVTRKKKV